MAKSQRKPREAKVKRKNTLKHCWAGDENSQLISSLNSLLFSPKDEVTGILEHWEIPAFDTLELPLSSNFQEFIMDIAWTTQFLVSKLAGNHETHGKTMEKPWENHGKTMGKPMGKWRLTRQGPSCRQMNMLGVWPSRAAGTAGWSWPWLVGGLQDSYFCTIFGLIWE